MPFLSHSLWENKGHLLKDFYVRVTGCSLSRRLGTEVRVGRATKDCTELDLKKVHAVCYLKAST